MSRAKEIAFQLSRQASGINPSAPEYTGPPEHWTEAVTRLEAENAVQAEEIDHIRNIVDAQAERIRELEHDMQELAKVANERNEHMERLLIAEREKNARLVEEVTERHARVVELYAANAKANARSAAQAEEIARLTKALERLAQPMDCGCNPCRGQCTSKESLELELKGLRDFAQAALTSSAE